MAIATVKSMLTSPPLFTKGFSTTGASTAQAVAGINIPPEPSNSASINIIETDFPQCVFILVLSTNTLLSTTCYIMLVIISGTNTAVGLPRSQFADYPPLSLDARFRFH